MTQFSPSTGGGGCLSSRVKDCNTGFKELQTWLYRTVQEVFGYLEPFGRNSRVWRTDGQTRSQHMPRFTTLGIKEANEACRPTVDEQQVNDRNGSVQRRRQGSTSGGYNVQRLSNIFRWVQNLFWCTYMPGLVAVQATFNSCKKRIFDENTNISIMYCIIKSSDVL